MRSIALLAEIIAQGGKSSAAYYRDNSAYDELLRHGFLSKAGVVASVFCDNCEDTHAAPVVFEAGAYGFHCPDLGLLPLSRAEIDAIKPNTAHLTECLAGVFGCSKRKRTVIHGRTWRIGALEADAGEMMLYFHPRLFDEEDAFNLKQALSREVRSRWRLIISASGSLPITGAQVVRLDDLVELAPDTNALRVLAQPADLMGMPRKNVGGRPSEYGARLARIITDRIEFDKTLVGLNEESRAILNDYKTMHSESEPPSFETVKRHLKKTRDGS